MTQEFTFWWLAGEFLLEEDLYAGDGGADAPLQLCTQLRATQPLPASRWCYGKLIVLGTGSVEDLHPVKSGKLFGSVPDLWHFGTDPDAYPDPEIRTFDKRIWMRILLFSSVTFKIPTKNYLFSPKFLCLFLFEGTGTAPPLGLKFFNFSFSVVFRARFLFRSVMIFTADRTRIQNKLFPDQQHRLPNTTRFY